MTIDMHSHWRPPVLADALRARTAPPLIETGADGVEVLKLGGTGTEPVAEAFDDLDERLAAMDRRGISTAALSLFGPFQCLEQLPLAESLPLLQSHNDALAEICGAHVGRFVAYATLPLTDMAASVAELGRTLELPGMVGAIVPGNAFLTYEDAQAYRPLLEVANRRRAVLFIHWGPRPGDAWPRLPAGADNKSPRLFTLDMQASLSSNMLTLCFTDLLNDYPDAYIHIHNLGGNLPFEIERLDHRNILDTPEEALPSTRLDKPNVYVDCNSFGARAIECGVAAYGAEKIMFGTDGTDFGCEWSADAIAASRIDDAAKRAILYDNAAGMLAHLAPLAPFEAAAE